MRVLIIKTSSLGDVIHALPVIDYLHQVSPESEIDWVVEEPFLPIVEHNPHLARIHVIRTKTWRRNKLASSTLREIAGLRAALRERQYDLVFDLQGNFKSGMISRFTGANQRIGFTADVLQEKVNALFSTRRVPFGSSDRTASDRYLRVVSTLFGRDFADMQLSGGIVSAPEDEAAAGSYLAQVPGRPVFFFQVGTTWNTKLWYPEGWSQLARRLMARYPGAAILINWGNPSEKELAERIVSEVGATVRLLPWLRIRELIPVIRRVDLVIGGDTGPLYLAAAVGAPTVSYYRATSAATYAPRGEQHRSVQAAMTCAGCGLTSCEKDAACRSSISVDALFTAVTSLVT
jgi:heptosyltransferase-1